MIGSASAPASSGNLGPGFDVLALALELRCRATAEPADTTTLTEEGTTKRLDDDDLVSRASWMAVERPMHITIDNEIPRARGLGSSSAVAAAVAGAAMKAMGDTGGRAKVFGIVDELEGHADNAAAAVFGGLVVATSDGVQRLELHESLVPVVAIPETHLRTTEARAALSLQVPRAMVVRNLARLVFLVDGLRTGNPETLRQAAGDELHEEPRAPLSPATGDLITAALGAGALHACWSGAGPSALAFTTAATTGRVIGAMSAVLGPSGQVLSIPPDTEGLV